MPDIFISYSHEDRPVARLYAEAFEREGLDVWWDQAITPGEAFDQVTEHALERARAVVVLWSQTSVNSRWVRAEATQANANNRLIPVMIESCRRPIIFELTHTADLSHWRGEPDDAAWLSFLAGVRRVVQRGASAEATVESPVPAPPAAPARPAPRPVPATRSAPRASSTLPRRTALLYGASAVGLAAAGFAGGLLMGSARSTDPAPTPSYSRLTFRRGLIRSARFAPDGQTILYGALWDGDICRVYSTRTDNPESRPLDLPHANLLAVSSTGDLAILLGDNLSGIYTYGTLARVPIAGGAPRELAEDVKFADWSPDGSALAIVRKVDGRDRLECPVGTVRYEPPAGEGGGLGFARIAGDGKRIAFVHGQSPQALHGRVCVLDGDRVTVLTDEYVNIHGLAWRGEEIWFSASDDRPLFRAVFAVKVGGAPRLIARLPVNVTVWDVASDGRVLIAQTDDRSAMFGRQHGEPSDRDLSWLDASWVADISRDGQTLLFAEYGQGVGAEPAAYLRGMDGSPAVRLGAGRPLALSPDSRWALVLESQYPPTSTSILNLVPTGAGDVKRLSSEGFRFWGARWLPDGQRVVLMGSQEDGGSGLYMLALPDGKPQLITPDAASWAVSPDGSMIAAAGGDPGVRLIPVDGSQTQAGPGGTGGGQLIGWIDDGLLVMGSDDPDAPRGEIYLLELATGRRRSWTNILPRDAAGLMNVGACCMTPDGRALAYTWHRALANLYLASGLA